MESQHSVSSITLVTFNELLAAYPAVVQPKLVELDESRYVTIPAALLEREPTPEALEKDDKRPNEPLPPRLTKAELLTLVEWKLSHGTFRPSLKKLVESNQEAAVHEQTGSAFAISGTSLEPHISDALNILTKLRGVGPATAALLLSVWNPDVVPFFSDELFRWTHWQSKPNMGWDRTIKYTKKEYLELFATVTELRNRLEVKAVDVEKVAYVLGKRAAGKSAEGGIEESGAYQKATSKRKAEDRPEKGMDAQYPQFKAKKTGKAADKQTKEPVTGSRTSVRLRSGR